MTYTSLTHVLEHPHRRDRVVDGLVVDSVARRIVAYLRVDIGPLVICEHIYSVFGQTACDITVGFVRTDGAVTVVRTGAVDYDNSDVVFGCDR